MSTDDHYGSYGSIDLAIAEALYLLTTYDADGYSMAQDHARRAPSCLHRREVERRVGEFWRIRNDRLTAYEEGAL